MEETKIDDISKIEVEKPNFEETDVSKEEIISKERKLKKIDEEIAQAILKQNKDDKIDWSIVEFAPEDTEKKYPLVSDEEIDMFAAVSDDVLDVATLHSMVRTFKSNIDEFYDIKSYIDNEKDLDESDYGYYKDCLDGKEQSRLMMAVIQVEGRKIIKEFEENHISEEVIRTFSHNLLTDLIIDGSRYRYTDNGEAIKVNVIEKLNEEEKEKVVNFVKRESEFFFLTRLFRTSIDKKLSYAEFFSNNTIDFKEKYNIFGAKIGKSNNSALLYALREHISMHADKDYALDINDIIRKHFLATDFFKSIIAFSMYKYNNNSFLDFSNIDKNNIEQMEANLNPENYYTNKSNNEFDKIHMIIMDIITNYWMDEKTIENIIKLTKKELENHKIHTNFKEFNMFGYEEYIQAIMDATPEIEGARLSREWAPYFEYLQTYNRFYMYSNIYIILKDKMLSNAEKTQKCFMYFLSFIENFYLHFYSNFITELREQIRFSINDKKIVPEVVGITLNTVLSQHDLGFKSIIKIGENETGEGLFNFAKDMFKEQNYKFIIGDTPETDNMLKDMNLLEIREEYYRTVYHTMKYIKKNLEEIKDLDTDEKFEKFCLRTENTIIPIETKHKKKKQSRSKRKGKK